MAPYSLLFGSGIRSDLETTYKRLKAKEGIIEQLVNAEGKRELHTSLKPANAKPAPDWKPTLDAIVAQVDHMRRADTPEQTAALGLLRAAAHLTRSSFTQPDDVAAGLKQVRRALSRLENSLADEDWD